MFRIPPGRYNSVLTVRSLHILRGVKNYRRDATSPPPAHQMGDRIVVPSTQRILNIMPMNSFMLLRSVKDDEAWYPPPPAPKRLTVLTLRTCQ